MRILRAAVLWLVLFLLAAFVIFVEFVAEVGGRADPIPKPSGNFPAITTPRAQAPEGFDSPIDDASYWGSSSNTNWPLS